MERYWLIITVCLLGIAIDIISSNSYFFRFTAKKSFLFYLQKQHKNIHRFTIETICLFNSLSVILLLNLKLSILSSVVNL